jgi:hypothetical protein
MDSAFEVRGLDCVPLWRSAWHKWLAFRGVSENRGVGALSQEEFLARWAAIHQRALRTKDLRNMTRGFWKMESLGAAYADNPPLGCTLSDPRLPVEILPIVHTGMGVAAVERGRFEPDAISEIIDSLAHPGYRMFAYESIGAMLGAYEVPFPKRLVGLKPLRRPDPGTFIRQFPSEIQWQISSGYGRLLFFNGVTVTAAFRMAARRPYLDPAAAIQGIAFACAMINHVDFWRIMETPGRFANSDTERYYRNGLIYALEFWEWETPGFLGQLNAVGSRSAELIAMAQRQIDLCRSRGTLNSFFVEEAPQVRR